MSVIIPLFKLNLLQFNELGQLRSRSSLDKKFIRIYLNFTVVRKKY